MKDLIISDETEDAAQRWAPLRGGNPRGAFRFELTQGEMARRRRIAAREAAHGFLRERTAKP